MAKGQITGPDLIADDVFARISKLDDELGGLVTQLNNIETAAKGALNTGQLNQQAAKANAVNTQANQIIAERTRLERELVRLQERNRQTSSQTSREIARQRVEIQEQARALKREETARNELVGAYRKMSAQLNILKDRYKDLAVSEKQSTAEGRKLAREIEVLNRRIRSADAAVGDFQRNVGNYRSALTGIVGTFRQLVGAFGLVEGIRFGVQFLRDASAVEREARGVQFAFERLGETGRQAFESVRESTRGLLSNLEIQRSLVEFDNFNISLEESATLFEFLAVRAAQTGRSIDDLRTSLVEGLSKESKLRIDNLGISAQELNEELEKTPNFVQAVANIARRELAEAGDIIDQAGNSAERFNALFQDTEVAIGGIVNSIKGFSLVNGILKDINTSSRLTNEFLDQQRGLWDFVTLGLRNFTAAGREENARLLQEIETRKRVTEQTDAQINALVRLRGVYGPLQQGQEEPGLGIPFAPSKGEAVRRTLEQINQEIDKQNSLLLQTTSRDTAAPIQERIAALQREREAILGVVGQEEKRVKAAKDSVAFWQEFINQQQQLRDATATTSQELASFNRRIEEAKGQIESLQGVYENSFLFNPEKVELSEVFDFFDQATDTEIQDALDVSQFLNTEGVATGMQELARQIKTPIEELYAEFGQLYQQDYNTFLEFSKRKIEQTAIEKEQRLEIAGQILNGLSELGFSLFQIAEQRAEAEVERQNEVFDSIINSKNATEEQIEIAEAKREENEKKLAKEREKRARQEFLFQQAIQVGNVLIADGLARINATATSFMLPFSLNPAYLPTALGIITTQTGIALATILAQTLPAFFTGKGLMDNYEGPATWGERGPEVRVSKDGRVEVSPNTTTPTFVQRDDLILRNVPLFRQQMGDPNSEVFKRVAGAWKQDTAGRIPAEGPTALDAKRIENSIDQGFKRAFKKVKNEIKVIVKPPENRVRRY